MLPHLRDPEVLPNKVCEMLLYTLKWKVWETAERQHSMELACDKINLFQNEPFQD